MKTMIQLSLGLVLLMGLSSVAEEIRITATVGEKTTNFTIKPQGGDYLMSYSASTGESKKVKIGKKNYEFTLSSAQEVIELSRKDSSKQEPCNRDLSSVEIIREQGAATGARVCLLAKKPQSKALAKLLNVLGMVL